MINLIVTLVILGIIFYCVETFIPMSAPFKTGVRIVAGLIVLVLLLQLLGIDIGAPTFNLR